MCNSRLGFPIANNRHIFYPTTSTASFPPLSPNDFFFRILHGQNGPHMGKFHLKHRLDRRAGRWTKLDFRHKKNLGTNTGQTHLTRFDPNTNREEFGFHTKNREGGMTPEGIGEAGGSRGAELGGWGRLAGVWNRGPDQENQRSNSTTAQNPTTESATHVGLGLTHLRPCPVPRTPPPASLRDEGEEEDDDGSEVERAPMKRSARQSRRTALDYNNSRRRGGNPDCGGRGEVKSIAPPGGNAMQRQRQRRRGRFLVWVGRWPPRPRLVGENDGGSFGAGEDDVLLLVGKRTLLVAVINQHGRKQAFAGVSGCVWLSIHSRGKVSGDLVASKRMKGYVHARTGPIMDALQFFYGNLDTILGTSWMIVQHLPIYFSFCMYSVYFKFCTHFVRNCKVVLIFQGSSFLLCILTTMNLHLPKQLAIQNGRSRLV
jgi:hypothetical protein